MPEPFRTQRLRDPVHGLITFRQGNKLDELAWDLLGSPPFQRLRRIKQLGVSEFVYPGASHSRLAHSIGVFHTARQLVEIIRREIGSAFEERKAEIAIIAALLHDIGHGPFSHTFEAVQKSRGVEKRHEKWTAEIIRDSACSIRPRLESFRLGFTEEVASLLEGENPKNIYHAVVSSSFDADRLDYLRRDRMMTGTGAGAIDFDWLLEHVRVREVNLDAVDGEDSEDGPKAPTFCLDIKALPAAEQFLLARFTLHQQVYFHKTTRCIEQMINVLLRVIAEHASDSATVAQRTGLQANDPIIRFFATSTPTVLDYLALDDAVILGALDRMTAGDVPLVRDLSSRVLERRLYKPLDIRYFGPDPGRQAARAKRIDKMFEPADKNTIIKDSAARLSIYTQVGGDDEKAHKKLRILDSDDRVREITALSDIVKVLAQEQTLTRYYFAKSQDRDAAKAIGGGGQ